MESINPINSTVTRPRFAMPSTAALGRTCSWRAVNRTHVKQVLSITGDVPGVPVWSPPHC